MAQCLAQILDLYRVQKAGRMRPASLDAAAQADRIALDKADTAAVDGLESMRDLRKVAELDQVQGCEMTGWLTGESMLEHWPLRADTVERTVVNTFHSWSSLMGFGRQTETQTAHGVFLLTQIHLCRVPLALLRSLAECVLS